MKKTIKKLDLNRETVKALNLRTKVRTGFLAVGNNSDSRMQSSDGASGGPIGGHITVARCPGPASSGTTHSIAD